MSRKAEPGRNARSRVGPGHAARPLAKVVCVGSVYLDVNVQGLEVAGGKAPEKEYVGRDYEWALGGSAVIFAQTVVALGLGGVLIGKIGADDFGVLVRRRLAVSGITADLVADDSIRTNLGINETAVDGATYMTVVSHASLALSPAELEGRIGRWLRSARYLYIGGLLKTPELTSTYAKIAREARSRGMKVVLDHGRMTDSVKRRDVDRVLSLLLPTVDLYLPSIAEALSVWNVADVETLFRATRTRTGAVTIVKMGEEGAVVAAGEGVMRVAPAEVIRGGRPVGIGDRFNAGVVAAIERGMDVVDAARYGNAVAALALGGRTVSHQAAVRLMSGRFGQK